MVQEDARTMGEDGERFSAEGGQRDGEQWGMMSQCGQRDIETTQDDSELDRTMRDDSELHESGLSNLMIDCNKHMFMIVSM
jgi:hypothetical protein